MSIVAYGLAIEPTALVGPAVWGYTRKAVIPPPVTSAVDPFAKKHANTQVIRESHLKKFLKGQKKRKVQRADLEAVPIALAGVLPAVVVGFEAKDARHLERAVKVIARLAMDQHYVPGDEDMALLNQTPEILKKIH